MVVTCGCDVVVLTTVVGGTVVPGIAVLPATDVTLVVCCPCVTDGVVPEAPMVVSVTTFSVVSPAAAVVAEPDSVVVALNSVCISLTPALVPVPLDDGEVVVTGPLVTIVGSVLEVLPVVADGVVCPALALVVCDDSIPVILPVVVPTALVIVVTCAAVVV